MRSVRARLLAAWCAGGVALAGCSRDGAKVADEATPHPAVAAASSAQAARESLDPPHPTEGDDMGDATSSGHQVAEPKHTNRLVDETSPYLLQHAHNPVDWYPWGEEAFRAAREQDRPIFLSVGYSTCYWCHVMERESFENDEIAAYMNAHFICIKVDREERPDLDDIYMTAVQAMTRHGGWPMSVFLEPESLKPFFGGTYFPPEDRSGLPGFMTVLSQIAAAWNDQRPAVLAQADHVAEVVSRHQASTANPVPIAEEDVRRAVAVIMRGYDAKDGGFGGAPKFPMPVNLDFLLAAGWDQETVRVAVTHTLDRMATGGMYDQIGGGFHRYSTDARWLVPHFEKMLYDNGQLAMTYVTAYERTGDAFYGEIAREICRYVRREMTHETGGYFSAQDAEVNAREGQNYIWTKTEITSALEAAGLAEDTELALEAYGFRRGPNFQDPHHPEDGRKNVVFLVDRPDRLASEAGLEPAELDARLSRINDALLAVRATRDQPGTDDKILSGWNGLMITGMAEAGRVLDEPAFIESAGRAADFILEAMRTEDGGLLRTSRAGRARVDAFCEDYAFMIQGLLVLHRATGDGRRLEQAEALAATARECFRDAARGGYFDTLEDQADLFVRTKSVYDGAVPCANSTMLHNLIELHARTGTETYLDDVVAALDALSAYIAERPASATNSARALHRMIELHPERITGRLADASRAEGQPVTIGASTGVIELAPGGTAALEVTLEMGDGWHINAHDPGLDNLVPLAVELSDGAGLSLEVEYPAGRSFDGPMQGMLVHSGRLTLPVRVRRTGTITGRPALLVTYQPCNDRECLRPRTDAVPLEIRPAE